MSRTALLLSYRTKKYCIFILKMLDIRDQLSELLPKKFNWQQIKKTTKCFSSFYYCNKCISYRKYIYKHINNNQLKSEFKDSIGNGNFFLNYWLWLHVVSKSPSPFKATATFLCCYWISGFWTAVWTRQMRDVIVPSEKIFQSLTRKIIDCSSR